MIKQHSDKDYHADQVGNDIPSLSSGIIKTLLDCSPAHAWLAHPRLNPNYMAERKTAFDIGHAAHAMMLGPWLGIGDKRFEIIDFGDYRKKEAQELRDAAYDADKIPLLRYQYDEVQEMVKAGKVQIAGTRECANAFFAGDGRAEVTLTWTEGVVAAKARLDWLDNEDNGIFYDYKTTSGSAHPEAARRHLYTIGADIQAAWYLRGAKANGLRANHFRFVVQETEVPYALSVIEFAPAALALAERKIDEALEIWGWCMSTGRWPGYPSRVCYVDAPSWEETRLDERRALGTPTDLVETAIRMQAP